MAAREFVPKNLGNGQLAGSKTALYTVPSTKTAIVRSIRLVNTSGSSLTINLTVNCTGTSRNLIPPGMSLGSYGSYEDDMPLTLESGDILEGWASSATTVDYVVSGVEET